MPQIDPNQPWQDLQFVSQMEQVLGHDAEPDPLFFVESWTIGVPAAVQNLQHRRQREVERRNYAFSELQSYSTLNFVQEAEFDSEFLSAVNAAAIADAYLPGLPAHTYKRTPEPAQSRSSQTGDPFNDFNLGQESARPLTFQAACRLLGVSSSSPRDQIRAAYRKMAGRYHPDRLERCSETERKLGTDRMSAINEAYRLLCN